MKIVNIVNNSTQPAIKIGTTIGPNTPNVPKPMSTMKIKPRNIFTNLTSVSGTTIEDIAKQCGMDFTAVKRTLSYNEEEDGNGIDIMNPEKVAIIRGDDKHYLGTVGKDFGLVQYLDMLKFTEELVLDGSASFTHGYTLGRGKQAFLVMKTDDIIELSPGDSIECYFYVHTAHDGSAAVSIVPAPLRKANNTVLLMPKMEALKFRHTKHVSSRIARAKETLYKVREYFTEYDKSFKRLSTVSITDPMLDSYYKALVPDSKENPTRAENVRGKITEIFKSEPSLQLPYTKGTLLGAYFAVALYADWYMTVKKSSKFSEVDARIHSRLKGAGARRKADALGVALKIKEKFDGSQ